MNKLLKTIGYLVASLIALILIALAFFWIRSDAMLNAQYAPPTTTFPILTDADAIARGEHIVTAISGCESCHGAGMRGGTVVNDPALGLINAPNLTRGQGGLGGGLSDADFIRILRYGIKPDSKSVLVMPANDYTYFNDADLGALIAYLKQLPPQDNEMPGNDLHLIGRILMATDQLPMVAERINFAQAGSAPMEPSVSIEYGEYLAKAAGCVGCHGPGLSGGKIPGTPPDFAAAANLTPSGEVGTWTEDQFIHALRTGETPAGTKISEEMPWMYYQHMTDDELKAIWQFVHSRPAKPAGTR